MYKFTSEIWVQKSYIEREREIDLRSTRLGKRDEMGGRDEQGGEGLDLLENDN